MEIPPILIGNPRQLLITNYKSSALVTTKLEQCNLERLFLHLSSTLDLQLNK